MRSISARGVGTRLCLMSIDTHSIAMLDGQPLDLEGLQRKDILVVNVASKYGLSPQYTGLEELQHKNAVRGFTVLGVPCNQFGDQEPGTVEEISTFYSSTYGITFPSQRRSMSTADARTPSSPNWRRRLTPMAMRVTSCGTLKSSWCPPQVRSSRFRPTVAPDAEELVSALKAVLPS
jgi:glutathione peroxidase